MTTTLAALVFPTRAAAQVLPPAKRAKHVRIVQTPQVELSVGHLTIIRWTTNNPGGTDEHYGVVQYGTRSQEPEQDGKVSDQVEPGPPAHDVPGTLGQPRATNDLLLPRCHGREQRQEGSAEESHRQIHHAGARRADTGFTSARWSRAARGSAVAKLY